MTKRNQNGGDTIAEQNVKCPFTGEDHTIVGPRAKTCPIRDVVVEWVENSP